MDADVKLYIKPGMFEKQSSLNAYNSSYQGLHSEESQSVSYSEEEIENSDSLSDNISNNSLSHSSSNNEIKVNDDKSNASTTEIIYTFIWDEGGTNVKVTGSFVNWATSFDMTYYPDEKLFKYKITLSKDKHSFKFIVDGIWKCSQKYQMVKDNSNNTNNFIDLTNYIEPKNSETKKKKL